MSQRQKWQLLSEACAASKLQLGEHDKRVLSWLATWEDSTTAVIAGLISRAGNRAGQRRTTAEREHADPLPGMRL